MVNDPIGDLIACIKNAAMRAPEGFRPRRCARPDVAGEATSAATPVGPAPSRWIELKYFDGAPVIVEISRVSKPGRRVYSSIKDLKPVKNGLGISILSTPKGVMSDTAARDANVGGEVLCRVY
jgi:small subunit ribosomal protein S8